MELRDIEIFLALAEELHFGRTAERLHVSQARVSQSIAKQERRIGAALFERSSRRVTLTPIGEQLRKDLQDGYQRILEGVNAAGAAARGTNGTLTLGTMGAMAHDIADITGLFRARHPGAELRFQEVDGHDPFRLVHTRELDIALVCLPIREPDLTVGPVLRARPLVLMAGRNHPLAQRASVSMEELGDHTALRPTQAGYWFELLAPSHTPGGRLIPSGPKVATWHECLAVVAAGEHITMIQAEAAVYFPWPDIAYVPITDATLGEWALVWRTAGETPLIRALVQAAEDALVEHPADSPPKRP